MSAKNGGNPWALIERAEPRKGREKGRSSVPLPGVGNEWLNPVGTRGGDTTDETLSAPAKRGIRRGSVRGRGASATLPKGHWSR